MAQLEAQTQKLPLIGEIIHLDTTCCNTLQILRKWQLRITKRLRGVVGYVDTPSGIYEAVDELTGELVRVGLFL